MVAVGHCPPVSWSAPILDPGFEQQLLDRTVNIEMENLEAAAFADKILQSQLLHENTKQSSLVHWPKNLQRMRFMNVLCWFCVFAESLADIPNKTKRGMPPKG